MDFVIAGQNCRKLFKQREMDIHPLYYDMHYHFPNELMNQFYWETQYLRHELDKAAEQGVDLAHWVSPIDHTTKTYAFTLSYGWTIAQLVPQ